MMSPEFERQKEYIYQYLANVDAQLPLMEIFATDALKKRGIEVDRVVQQIILLLEKEIPLPLLSSTIGPAVIMEHFEQLFKSIQSGEVKHQLTEMLKNKLMTMLNDKKKRAVEDAFSGFCKTNDEDKESDFFEFMSSENYAFRHDQTQRGLTKNPGCIDKFLNFIIKNVGESSARYVKNFSTELIVISINNNKPVSAQHLRIASSISAQDLVNILIGVVHGIPTDSKCQAQLSLLFDAARTEDSESARTFAYMFDVPLVKNDEAGYPSEFNEEANQNWNSDKIFHLGTHKWISRDELKQQMI